MSRCALCNDHLVHVHAGLRSLAVPDAADELEVRPAQNDLAVVLDIPNRAPRVWVIRSVQELVDLGCGQCLQDLLSGHVVPNVVLLIVPLQRNIPNAVPLGFVIRVIGIQAVAPQIRLVRIHRLLERRIGLVQLAEEAFLANLGWRAR